MSFHFKMNCLPLFFSPEAGSTDGCFVDTMESKTQSTISKNAGTTVYCRIVNISCLPSKSDRELWLFSLPSFMREYHTPYPQPRKDQNSQFKVWFLLSAYHFQTIIKSKSHKSNHLKSGTICISTFALNRPVNTHRWIHSR